ncbi:hypothetical protein C1T17_06195 [Sphingobium sp. SCG-1]|uniref:invasion associated locus B family protein n=1 Tax=Sphingobium sp. SCG-1 TaxID=2072936 RepID=UPI000CD67674|nr:invasion associated locus B family protein [Sphingobium sp. SCG-1]AUW60118.1 hypothetical protein C1T17_06195 [Sphingobium sp. SCG-1]
MKRTHLLGLIACTLIGAQPFPAAARDSLGIFESWGAFRDPTVPRCYAIAEPARGSRRAGWQAFASVATWPRQGVRGQLHIRLSQSRRTGSAVSLSIGEQHFALVAGNADAWAPDKRVDAAIIAAMRSGTSMSVQTVANSGRGFADVYALRGAATAIDAAALGCARR